MPEPLSFFSLGALALEADSLVPLYRQIYEKIREAILTGQLAGGVRLPPSRALATELGVSRNTVVNAFEQLMAEGYLEGKIGAGTYVSQALPEEALQLRNRQIQQTLAAQPGPEAGPTALSKRGATVATTPVSASGTDPKPRPFRPGLPALDAFPYKLWEKIWVRRWRTLSSGLLGYGQAAGYQPLREAVAAHLSAARGVHCEAAQVLIVAGAQQAIDLAARLLLDPGDAVWVEDPGYLGAKGALRAAGAQLEPVPVDHEGLQIEQGITQAAAARMVYITPSHQYPLGVTMSLARRLALLEWAAGAGAWILEDDYDSEYRYAGRPLAALQGLDQTGRVIYIGTFSKVLFPALRLGYLVAPPTLVDAFAAAAALINRCPPLIDQLVLTDFIYEGHFARHIRRMRTLYAERQAVLIEAAQQRLAGLLDIKPAETGLHVTGWLAKGLDAAAISQALDRRQVEAPALSTYAMRPLDRQGLVLGYAAVNNHNIQTAVQRMEIVLQNLLTC